MVEDKLAHIILKRLFDDYASSFDFSENLPEGCMILRYGSCCDVSKFQIDCTKAGIVIGDAALSIAINNIIELTSFPKYGMQSLDNNYLPEEVFPGEIIRIKFSSDDGMDLMKLSAGSWWIPYAYGSVKHLWGTYPDVSGRLGSESTLYVNNTDLTASSAMFVVPTRIFLMIDHVLHPSCYLKESFEIGALESIMILLNNELICTDNKLDFRKWRGIADISYAKGFDYKTFWYLTNALANQLRGKTNAVN